MIYISCPPIRPGTYPLMTRVDRMDVEQTAQWLKNFSESEHWQEAEEYSRNFRENAMTGILLQDLTDEDLEELGIKDEMHKEVLLNTISFLYSKDPYSILHSTCQQPVSRCNGINNSPCETSTFGTCSGSTYHRTSGVLCHTSEVDSDQIVTQPRRRSIETIQGSCTDVTSTQAHSLLSSSETKLVEKRQGLGRLTLVLREDQMLHDENTIREQFANSDMKIQHVKKEGSTNRYSLLFESNEIAAEALSKAKDLGYKLTRRWHNRPGPKNHVDYVNTSGEKLIMRAGKAFSGEVVGLVEPNERITVNQMKGRRVRIIHVVNGKTVVRGWVSMISKERKQFLEEFESIMGGQQYQDVKKNVVENEQVVVNVITEDKS